MKNFIRLLCLASLIVISSCTDKITEEVTEEIPNEFITIAPKLPSNLDIDIDDDGVYDYYMDYGQFIVFSPTHGERFEGDFKSYNKNEVLLNKHAQNLFLRDLNDIQETVAEPLYWNIGKSKTLISIKNYYDIGWTTKWDIHSDTKYDTYFLGLKLIKDNAVQLGWIEIEINNKKGTLKIIDKGVF